MEIKYYKAGIACRSLASKAPVTGTGKNANVAVIPFLDIDGSSHEALVFTESSSYAGYSIHARRSIDNMSVFNISNIYASTDSTFDIDEYSAKNIVGRISYSAALGITGRTFRISVYNNTANPITVNSFKFVKNDLTYGYNTDQWMIFTALVFWVKLDSAVTIAAGETKDFVIDINFLNE